MSKQEEDCPKFVADDVCKARMDAMYAWIKATFASTVIAVALIIISLLRGA